jgi:hypothetical protein
MVHPQESLELQDAVQNREQWRSAEKALLITRTIGAPLRDKEGREG